MLSFISRRLLQMAILLPLLSLLVFKVISMMPNPLEERMSANPKMKATDKKRLEKIYHFDKPPLFNWSIRDLPRNVTYHLAHLLPPQAPKVFEEETEYQKLRSSQNQNWGAEEQKRLKVLEKKKEQYETEMGAYRQARDQHEVALDHFKNWGKVTLPYLIEAEGKAQKRAEKDPQHQAFLEALRSLLQKISGKTEEQGPSGVMVWKDWYSTYQERLSPIRLKKTLLQLTKEDQQESAQQEIREIGTPYLEGLILKLQEEPALADEELQIVLDLLYDISTNLQESSDVLERQEAQRKKFKASDRERALYYWTEWWKNNGSDYKVLSSGTRFLRMFSHTQYGIWLGRILRSLAQGRFLSPDLGNSSTYKEPVAHLVSHKILNTLKLTLTAFFLKFSDCASFRNFCGYLSI
jgi:hypothetical protein